MKRYKNRLLVSFLAGTALLIGISLFLYMYRRDEKLYTGLTSELFREEMLASTLNMHYTLAYPADFGIEKYDAILPCYETDSHLRTQASTENILTSLHRINPDKLSDADAYAHKLLTRFLQNSLALNSYPYYEEPLSPTSGMQSQLPILLAEYTFRHRQDVTDYLALLDQTDEYFASLLCYEQEKAAAGMLMPTASAKDVIAQCDTIVAKEDLEQGTHFLQSTFQERLQTLCDAGELTISETEELIAQNNRLLKTVVQPAYEALADGLFLLEQEAVPLTGLAAKPQGAEYYQYLLRSETGSYRDMEDIRALLVEAFSQEYESIQALSARTPGLTEYLSANEELDFPYLNAEDMLQDLQKRMQKDFPTLPPETSRIPGTYANDSSSEHYPTVSVKSVSPSLEKYCAPAFYLTAPLDDTDNNVIYINEKNSPCGLELYTTLAHEGYPGHLYQTVYCNRMSLAQDENIVREILWYGGYLEGWALYVEFLSYDYAAELMQEHNRPMDAAYIELEKHNRSLQLCLYSLLDIMIHYDNASTAQIAEVLQHFGINKNSSINAIYSYIAEEPCNYLKYYLGYLEILALREKAQALWKDTYTDYTFHKFYLDCGPSDFTSLSERLESETVRKN